ncbi:3-oxoacyl-[acyl-carrier-protein] synthase II [Thermoactinomyces sp. DSM 45891]|uniref:beta-ketoacyl-[acyl-carrier-protein] synthase family protein n=1 Tax=Thermoactinomyces sp. DSM 45891 TaxID=1761907 RepID=UPI0009186717|nr:beta-ketoacyl-[acyl-carrier-protein] synthase family protein [Thermoactinomyces sp. DSM 45891]SFW99589.1 3-oxoacyl-[acyl-carrier-protein] synthase II [Thermoactinomyces sp. DSM 45891]
MSIQKARIAVTGVGIICANGNDVEEFWDHVVAGKSGIKPVTSLDLSQINTKFGGEVSHFSPEDHFTDEELKHMDRAGQFAVLAAREAIQFAKMKLSNLDPYRVGIVLGTSLGGMRSGEIFHKQWIENGLDETDVNLLYKYPVHTPCDNIAHALGIKGPKSVISNACAAGTNSIGYATDIIRTGKADVMIAGGVDPLTFLSFSGFNSLQALSNEPCAPYSQSHGLNIGEGAGILVLERMEDACARGATILAEVLDYDLSADSYHQTAPDPGGAGAIRSMKGALNKAGLTEQDLSYINGHGTGTPTNDASEPKALRSIIKEQAVPISSTKSMLGHTLGAAGAVEAVTSVLAIHRSFIPPTVNFDEKSQKFDLDFVPNKGREAEINTVLSNSFAFGGNNATALFGKHDEQKPTPAQTPRKKVLLTGVGVLAGNVANMEQFDQLIKGEESGISEIHRFDTKPYGQSEAGQIPDIPYKKMINPSMLRRMDALSKQAVAVTKMALDDAKFKITRDNSEKVGVIFATGTGPTETVESFNRVVIQEGAKMANAQLFPNTVMNAAAGHIGLHFKIKGPTSTITAGGVSAISALYYAYSLIQLGGCDTVIVVTSDEFNEPLLAGHGRIPNFLSKTKSRPFASDRDGVVLGEGSVAMIVESEEAAKARNARILAECKGFGMTSDHHKIAGLNPEGTEWTKSFELALSDAGLATEDIGYISAAANGHPIFDPIEAKAIHQVFQDQVPVSAPGSIFGETHGTAGSIGLLTALSALDGTIPFIRNLENPMLDVNLDYVMGEPRKTQVDHALISSYAYGGNYHSLVLSRYV